jgi:hypothetical protein
VRLNTCTETAIRPSRSKEQIFYGKQEDPLAPKEH